MREYVLVQNLLLPGLRPLLVALAAALTGSLAFVSVAWALPFVIVLVASWWLLLRHMPSVARFGGALARYRASPPGHQFRAAAHPDGGVGAGPAVA